jgi:hypothetical protein
VELVSGYAFHQCNLNPCLTGLLVSKICGCSTEPQLQ